MLSLMRIVSFKWLVLLKKMVLDVALLNTQYYKVMIKGNGAIQGME